MGWQKSPTLGLVKIKISSTTKMIAFLWIFTKEHPYPIFIYDLFQSEKRLQLRFSAFFYKKGRNDYFTDPYYLVRVCVPPLSTLHPFVRQWIICLVAETSSPFFEE
jgi:hypothetical protein